MRTSETGLCAGWGRVASLLGVGVMLALVSPLQASAFAGAPGDITQGEYLQWLAKAGAKKASLPANPSAADYVKWAATRGIMPEGGWQLEAQLTREVYARTLAQL